MADNSACNPELVLAHKFSEKTFTYTERDVALYTLGVGACGRDAVDTDELKYVYHENGQQFIKVLPTFSTLFSLEVNAQLSAVPSLWFDKRLLLHGQQYIEINKPFPANGTIHNKVTLAGLHDKGKASVLELETRSYEKESGELLSMNRTSLFLRGAGGFSDPSRHFTYSNYPVNQTHMKSQNLSRLWHYCIDYLVTTILSIQIPWLGRQQDSQGQFCMDCALLGLQHELSSNVFAGEIQT
ncbi:Enoyl-CoA hydratase 2, peroxisomal [Hibiscus syriacus]|uniref:Enoyl-CoA hydratase 2, peroxisomal n=1 Tax=Hibiscus syriacus TaxID=106335 RepID=A0A6A3ADP3_HIBSY|nr:Enoyl-CoA hydratase 2, peroxisomal [Hibiscus syriacus]